MITKNIARRPKSIVEVQVDVPWSDLEPKLNKALAKLSQDVEPPEFREGGSFNLNEFSKIAMTIFLAEALKGTDIIPIDYPKYDLISFVKGQQLQFKATFTNRPQVSVGNYKSIKVTRPQPKLVTDDEVNKVIDNLYKRWKTGQSAGQTEPVESTIFSSDQHIQLASTSRAAQPAVAFEQPDDNFARAIGAKDLIDLKGQIRKALEANTSYNNELDFEEAILQEVEKITQVDLPEVLIEGELNSMLVALQQSVTDMGFLLDDYLKSQNKTLEQLKNEWRTQAEKNVQMELGLAEIARRENLTVTDLELKAEIDKIQDQRVKKQFEAQKPKLHLRHALRQTRTLNFLKSLVTSS